MEISHITCSTDDNYIQHCMAMLCSLFENNKELQLVVHLLHHGLDRKNISMLQDLAMQYEQTIRFYDVDESALGDVAIASYHPDLSISTYYRLFLPSLLDEDVHRILYLDCDVIVLRSLTALFHLDIDGYGVAAVRDGVPYDDHHRNVMGLALDDRAFCAGVMLINLDYWRKRHSQDHMLDFANKMGSRLVMEDQDVLNHEFRNQWFELPYKYGRTPMAIVPQDRDQKEDDKQEYFFSPVIIHYAAHVKPWLDISIPDDQYYWKYVKLSGFPNPVKIHASDYNRKRIQKAKIRYYLNFYIRPYIPDIVEILLRDIMGLVMPIFYVTSLRKFRTYHLRRWLHKYKM